MGTGFGSEKQSLGEDILSKKSCSYVMLYKKAICYVLSLVEDAICQSRCRIIWSTLKKELIIVKKGYKKSQQNPKNPHETPFWLTSFFVWKACSKLELAKN